ncbi:MAG TPA: hypothetical protein VHF51_06035 [Solirubrobacteraceae bacterium]|nr:hypothetical protein [Solirubrobacteraceae bacterium]
MVRGVAALLGLALGALAYFLVAPALPALRSLDDAVAVAATAGLAFAVGLAAAPAPAAHAPFSLAPAVLGAALLVAALNAARAGAAASPFEALLLGCAGVAFAALLDAPALAVALPLFVGLIDVSGVVGTGPGTLLVHDAAPPGDPLTVELPGWGGGLPAARVTAAELVFVGAFAGYAQRFELRPRASALAMYVALVAAVVAGLAVDRRVPALALMSGAFLAVNADRLGGLFASPRDG